MANRLAKEQRLGVMQIFSFRMSAKEIARTLYMDRKSVDRELRAQGAKGASPIKAPAVCENSKSRNG